MIILKSFFRKKRTKIYICLLSVIIFIFLITNNFRSYYYNKVQEEYDNYITYEVKINKANIDTIINTSYIKDYIIGLDLTYNEHTVLFTGYTEELSINDIIIKEGYLYEEEVSVNNVYIFKNIEHKDLKVYQCLIPADIYNELYTLTSFITLRFKVSDWKYADNIKETLEERLGYDSYLEINYIDAFNSQLITIITYIDIFIIIFLIISIIIFGVIMINIIVDEKKLNKVYRCIGFPYYKIIIIDIFKLLLLSTLGLFISITIYYIYINIFL